MANFKSTQVTNMDAAPATKLPTDQHHGRLRFAFFNFVAPTGGLAANDTIDLVKIPSNARIIKSLSKVNVDAALGAARLLDIGHLAYTKQDGTAVSASTDNILDGGDLNNTTEMTGGVGTNAIGANTLDLDNRDLVNITATLLGGTMAAARVLFGYIVYVVD